jgi:hypothetical protein
MLIEVQPGQGQGKNKYKNKNKTFIEYSQAHYFQQAVISYSSKYRRKEKRKAGFHKQSKTVSTKRHHSHQSGHFSSQNIPSSINGASGGNSPLQSRCILSSVEVVIFTRDYY